MLVTFLCISSIQPFTWLMRDVACQWASQQVTYLSTAPLVLEIYNGAHLVLAFDTVADTTSFDKLFYRRPSEQRTTLALRISP